MEVDKAYAVANFSWPLVMREGWSVTWVVYVTLDSLTMVAMLFGADRNSSISPTYSGTLSDLFGFWTLMSLPLDRRNTKLLITEYQVCLTTFWLCYTLSVKPCFKSFFFEGVWQSCWMPTKKS